MATVPQASAGAPEVTPGGAARYRDQLCNQSSLEPTSPASFIRAANRSRS